MQNDNWLPLTEYAMRSGTSISTLRRKIKSNTISYKMEEGRYLIRADQTVEDEIRAPYQSSDRISAIPAALPSFKPTLVAPIKEEPKEILELNEIRKEMGVLANRMHQENSLQWRALEARVSGIAKKLENFSEQVSELKMLVKLFEEKLDSRS